MNWLISTINNEFEDKFAFLKLLEVKYNKLNKFCLITFLYPNQQDFKDKDKKILTEFIKKQLNLYANIEVKYRKSYLDDDLLKKVFLQFVKINYPSVYALSKDNKIDIVKEFNHIVITFDIDKNAMEYLDEEKFKNEIKLELESKFCCEIIMMLNQVKSKKELKFIERKIEDFAVEKTPRYEIEIIKNIFGRDFSPNPEFIKNIKKEKSDVILAGRIEDFEKKSYTSKKEKDKGQLKYYYSFYLNDTTKKIDVKYFTNKTNEKKMDKLVCDQEVAILGDIRMFNSKLSLYIKSIALCLLPEKIEDIRKFSKDYELIFPESHSIIFQENLFRKSKKYSEEINKNTFVVFDVETTGLDYQTEEIVEIGAVKVENGKIVSTWETLVKPKKPIPLTATEINNITDEMVKNSPPIEIAIRDFFRFAKGAKMVGYNVAFDQKFIQKAAKENGIFFENEFVDVMPLAKEKLRLTRYRLSDVVKRLEISLSDAHRALADSMATAEAFLELHSDRFIG